MDSIPQIRTLAVTELASDPRPGWLQRPRCSPLHFLTLDTLTYIQLLGDTMNNTCSCFTLEKIQKGALLKMRCC